jgi:hypothetical protein
MDLPGFTAEASLFRLSSHYTSVEKNRFPAPLGVISQQFDSIEGITTFEFTCSPCRPRFGGGGPFEPRVQWRESVASCSYPHFDPITGQDYFKCGLCRERSCTPRVERISSVSFPFNLAL